MNRFFNIKYLPLFVILIVALTLRIYKLSEFPIGFHGDEASLAYNAYSILQTGKDENGDFLPLHSYISKTYRPIGYTYFAIPAIALFGLNEFSARFPSAFFGALTVIPFYYLATLLYSNRKIGLIAAFFLTINPWHIGLSRASAETLVALFFMIVSLVFVFTYLRKQSIMWLTGAFGLMVVSFLIYPAPRVVLPILLFYIIIVSCVQRINRSKIMSLVALFLMIVVVDAFFVFGSRGGAVKFQDVGIFSYQEPAALLGESIREEKTGMPVMFTRIFHNKVKTYINTFLGEYASYYTYSYLIAGEIYPERYRIPMYGLLYLFELPLLFIGIVASIFKRTSYFFPIMWLLVGPAAAALTWEDTPNILRSLPMLPALILIVSYGLFNLWLNVKTIMFQKIIAVFVCMVILYSFLSFTHQYYVHAPVHKPWYRDAGFEQLVLSVMQRYNQFDTIVVTKAQPGPYIQFLFHLKYDPVAYQRAGSPRDDDFKGFDKFIFVPVDCPFDNEPTIKRELSNKLAGKKVLYVVNGICRAENVRINELITIYRPDNSPVFKLWAQQ